jgi:hypothetical protein
VNAPTDVTVPSGWLACPVCAGHFTDAWINQHPDTVPVGVGVSRAICPPCATGGYGYPRDVAVEVEQVFA